MAKTCPACESRKAQHPAALKEDLAKRLNRIEGQIKGIKKMIEDDVYCDEALNQITSAQSALNSVRIILLEKHIKSCVLERIQEGDLTVVDELMKTIQRMTRQ